MTTLISGVYYLIDGSVCILFLYKKSMLLIHSKIFVYYIVHYFRLRCRFCVFLRIDALNMQIKLRLRLLHLCLWWLLPVVGLWGCVNALHMQIQLVLQLLHFYFVGCCLPAAGLCGCLLMYLLPIVGVWSVYNILYYCIFLCVMYSRCC